MSSDVLDLLREPRMTKICAPMVRYSKIQFRTLVRKYNCDLCFTPMILADSFVKSSAARASEFTTNKNDKPLIVQFAAKEIDYFVGAAELIAPYSNGVDLNCGCPQRWALKDGYGADLLTKPELVKDLVYQVRNRISKPFSVSIKIRILKDIKRTIELCQAVEHAGLSFLTVHARTPQMRNEPIQLESLKLVKSCVQLPVIANGNVKCLEDAMNLYTESNCNGIMVAGGILNNPALFSGYRSTPVECIRDWINITSSVPTTFLCFHNHLVFMLEKVLNKKEKQVFNYLNNVNDVYDFLNKRFDITPKMLYREYELTNCEYQVLPQIRHPKNINFDEDEDCSLSLENLFI
ncbi:PREDICTED: tRNA-dihydrouridine(20a/20b) synthase [NAD(P)+]-like [Ceratosolen solmsi marchali]|uniref:tRNA-dihydrouridine(20a/20b) synthase [NAD(P)+] n=1 Tax=Ceratosolen solmsi marchali TaxID=326594 RepID=A0AAJ6YPE3_9HYME|nr:PREDICTED: tRNA-dihydrouridine(20a/20b) synthase [NAD(P)+]-like [Ceratosolen solmsi marchali]